MAVTAAGALLTAAASGTDDLGVVALADAVLLLGLIVLTPALALGVTRLLRRPLTRPFGVHGTLAVENTRRNPRRTAATAATLMIGLALVSAATVATATRSRAAAEQARQAMVPDLEVTPVEHAEIGPGTAERVARLPDTAAVTAPRRLRTRETAPGRLSGRHRRRPPHGRGIAVTRQEARAHNWQAGSRVTGTVDGTRRRHPNGTRPPGRRDLRAPAPSPPRCCRWMPYRSHRPMRPRGSRAPTPYSSLPHPAERPPSGTRYARHWTTAPCWAALARRLAAAAPRDAVGQAVRRVRPRGPRGGLPSGARSAPRARRAPGWG
ncbi:hypothetical protein ITI46_00905 [Streptomyces oryzae]|uniref:ABC transporter permease n=1 Tax=Streptomyces oryzae TaxID=1434886 RepID=A0ABS3X4I1_9ACTN|nr:hypothetical protein [Streptomyces oryzae]